MTDGWAFIDTATYWDAGVKKVGEYGMVEFLSDRTSRDLTTRYRAGKGIAGYAMPDRYFVIRVKSKIQNEAVFALYDDIAHEVLFDEGNLLRFHDLLAIFSLTDKTGNIVDMAKKRIGAENDTGRGQ